MRKVYASLHLYLIQYAEGHTVRGARPPNRVRPPLSSFN